MNLDVALHPRGLDRSFAANLQLPELALADDSGFIKSAVGCDAGALDLFASGNLGLLQRLYPGDLELLDGAPALKPGEVE